MLKKWVVLFSATLFVLAACHSPVYNQTQGNVVDVKLKIEDSIKKSNDSAKTAPAVLVKEGSYVDTNPIDLDKDPSWLRHHIIIRGDQLPFSYYSRTIASGASDRILTRYQTGLDASTNISINYSGTVKGALDLIAAKTGFIYTVKRNTIYWQAFVTRTFDIAFMPGDSDYLMGKKGAGASTANTAQGSQQQGIVASYVSSDSSSSEYSNLSAKLSIWKDLEAALNQLKSTDGVITVSQATTTATVRDRPTNVELMAKYIENLNHNLSKQVLVKIQVLEIQLENDFNFGINWNLIARAFIHSPFQLTANYGTPISIKAFSGTGSVIGLNPTLTDGLNAGRVGYNTWPSYQVLFNALEQQGHTSVVSEPRVVCLNNQVSVIRIVTQKGYLASIQNTTAGTTAVTGNSVTSAITPGTIVTGITLYILPKIMDNKVFLQVNADLSTDNGVTTFGTNGSDVASPTNNVIQLPNITEKSFNQRSMIASGDTLILSGFKQASNQANAMQLLKSQALGGKGAKQLNVETIILITPIVLSGSI